VSVRNRTSGPRRVNVERGIYRGPSDGKYEVCYEGSDGKTKWKTVDGGLREARQLRADLVSRLARGERIAPTKLTLADYAPAWLASQTQLRPRTRDWYGSAIRIHIVPKLGRRKLADVTTDDVAQLIAEMREAGYAAWTIKGVLVPLSRMLSTAARRGMIASNPVARLERGERPQSDRREMRVLDRAEIAKLLDATPEMYRTLIATSVFTGLRQSEALGLVWADVDLEGGRLHVRRQLGRDGQHAEPKTPQAKRSVVLMPSLVRVLREHKARAFAVGRARPDSYVFASQAGGPLHYRNVVRRGLDKAVATAGLDLDGKPKLRWHDLRHTAASLLVAEGLNVTYVSRQLGHADPSITLKVYARMFDAAEHSQRASDALEASFGGVLSSIGG
jgi:integrase